MYRHELTAHIRSHRLNGGLRAQKYVLGPLKSYKSECEIRFIRLRKQTSMHKIKYPI